MRLNALISAVSGARGRRVARTFAQEEMDELERFHTARRHYQEYLKAQRELRWRVERALKPRDKTRKAVENLSGIGNSNPAQTIAHALGPLLMAIAFLRSHPQLTLFIVRASSWIPA